MTDSQTVRLPAPSLPATTQDLLAARRTARPRTLNDYVDEIHVALWEQETYTALLSAIWREETVEGSIIADDLQAASLIREYAKENGVPAVAGAKLAAIQRSLSVVLRRYGLGVQWPEFPLPPLEWECCRGGVWGVCRK